jgi:hypothetical protein
VTSLMRLSIPTAAANSHSRVRKGDACGEVQDVTVVRADF